MSILRMIKGDNVYITFVMVAAAGVLAFFTIMARISSCTPPAPAARYDYPFAIENVSYITLKQSKAQVLLKVPSLPTFSENWSENPYLYVDWTIQTRAGEKYSGRSLGALVPPYDSFIFSIQDDLEKLLAEVHPEEMFVYEYRLRILREVSEIWLEIKHPETDEVLDSFNRTFEPKTDEDNDDWSIS
jgi:hypothetical protein